MRKNRADHYVTTQEEFTNNLRMIREDRDLTQQEIADILGTERSTYTYYESGETLPNIFTIIKLARFYGVDIRYVLMNLRSAEFFFILYYPNKVFQLYFTTTLYEHLKKSV